MKSKCFDCPRTMEYIDLGGCPNCKTRNLLMNTKTHIAFCDVCGEIWGIPTVIEGLCYDDERFKQYTISINANLDKQQLLAFSKLIGINSVQAYHLFKNSNPVVLENVPMILTYTIRNYFSSIGAAVSIQPKTDEYHMFEECWNI